MWFYQYHERAFLRRGEGGVIISELNFKKCVEYGSTHNEKIGFLYFRFMIFLLYEIMQ